MGLFKYILGKFKCSSSCMYNIENEIYDNNKFNVPISHYELKYKDLKTIMKILNKRERITIPRQTVEI